jgi:outer membrane protein assembly factor BamD (BamD/ComL family)
MASASSPETLLQSALIALKQKDYGTAIATFSTLQHHGNASTAQRLKAEMGLVRAYVGQGETATAIALCERLRQRPSPRSRPGPRACWRIYPLRPRQMVRLARMPAAFGL